MIRSKNLDPKTSFNHFYLSFILKIFETQIKICSAVINSFRNDVSKGVHEYGSCTHEHCYLEKYEGCSSIKNWKPTIK